MGAARRRGLWAWDIGPATRAEFDRPAEGRAALRVFLFQWDLHHDIGPKSQRPFMRVWENATACFPLRRNWNTGTHNWNAFLLLNCL